MGRVEEGGRRKGEGGERGERGEVEKTRLGEDADCDRGGKEGRLLINRRLVGETP